jgi:hypothetical protein
MYENMPRGNFVGSVLPQIQNSSNQQIGLCHYCLLTMYVCLCLSVLINAISKYQIVTPKGVSSNRTALFNTSFFTYFGRSEVGQNRCSSYRICFVLVDSPGCGCFRDILSLC